MKATPSAIAPKKLTIFGAGASVSAGYPTAAKIARELEHFRDRLFSNAIHQFYEQPIEPNIVNTRAFIHFDIQSSKQSKNE